MKCLWFLLVLGAVAAAPPVSEKERALLRKQETDAKILEDDVRKSPDGSYTLT